MNLPQLRCDSPAALRDQRVCYCFIADADLLSASRQPWAFPEAAHKENMVGVFFGFGLFFLEGMQSDTKRELTACFHWIDSTFSEAVGPFSTATDEGNRETSTPY